MAAFLLLCVLGTVAVGFVAWCIFESIDTRPLSQIIDETATKTVADYFASDEFKAIIERTIEQTPSYKWTVAMARYFRSVDASISSADAVELALETTREYLRDEGIEFGDPRYAWDAGGAREVADDYQVDHWERPAA